MTTIAELLVQPPDLTHGEPLLGRPAVSGEWRVALQIADPVAGSDVEWFDLTAFYTGDSESRGSGQAWGRNQPATGQVTLTVDQTGADALGVSLDILAPWGVDTSDLFGVNIELDGGLLLRFVVFRVASGVTVEWEPQWTGRVETWGDAASALGQIRTHTVTWTDVIGDLVDVPTPAHGSSEIEFDIDALLTAADLPYGWDIYCVTDAAEIPLRDEQPSTLTELDLVCDSVGMVWRSRRNGRLVFHPAPWDQIHDGWPNPILDSYPGGLTFSHNPDTTNIAYVADDNYQPFGIQRSSLGVINNIVATLPTRTYPVDDASSKSKHGTRSLALTFLVDNDPASGPIAAIDQLLTARASASVIALPMTVSSDLEGFWPAMSTIDHLDPVTIVHASSETGIVVTATGVVRHVRADREFLTDGTLNWFTTVQFDLYSTDVAVALLPVEDLAADPGGRVAAFEATWTNPGGQPVTPTDTQVRTLGVSNTWIDQPYPITSLVALGAQDATTYEFQVRLIRRVSGFVTHQSPIRSVLVTTNPGFVIEPGPGGGDTDVTFPDPAGDGCDVEWELQENDGDPDSWVTIDSGDQDDLTDNGDGTYTLNIDESLFSDDAVYRVRTREVCGGTPGDWITGPSFDPPDDWTDPCPDPPVLTESPFTEASLRVFFPQVCAPDTIGVLVYD